MRSLLLRPGVARAVLILQILPILALRPASYALATQEWWLAALLALLALIAAAQVLARGTHAPWPWSLFSFSQGFSIISKLMMLMPHAAVSSASGMRLDTTHLAISLASMAASAFVIWYCDQPEVRGMFAARATGGSAGR